MTTLGPGRGRCPGNKASAFNTSLSRMSYVAPRRCGREAGSRPRAGPAFQPSAVQPPGDDPARSARGSAANRSSRMSTGQTTAIGRRGGVVHPHVKGHAFLALLAHPRRTRACCSGFPAGHRTSYIRLVLASAGAPVSQGFPGEGCGSCSCAARRPRPACGTRISLKGL